MFEKLVESDSAGAEFKKRKGYFLVSTVVVGILFVTAVVVSIYAADYSLGTATFELSQIVAPEDIVPVEPEEVTPQTPRAAAAETSALPTRQVNMQRVDEPPTVVPTGVSVTPNSQRSRPAYDFVIGQDDTDPAARGPVDRATTSSGTGPGLQVGNRNDAASETDTEPPPPTVKREPVTRKPISKGVITGLALSLPKPSYSAAAKAVGAHGQVQVQVTIDEEGRVISANAVTGNVLLRADAERAARNARFSPTKLSDVPVKVTGVIVYNFTR